MHRTLVKLQLLRPSNQLKAHVCLLLICQCCISETVPLFLLRSGFKEVLFCDVVSGNLIFIRCLGRVVAVPFCSCVYFCGPGLWLSMGNLFYICYYQVHFF